MKKEIMQDLKEALLSKDALRVSTLRMLLAAITNKEKEKRYRASTSEPTLLEQELRAKSELSPQELQDVVSSEVKKRREAIEGFEKGGRKEQAEKEKQEMELLLPYLPEQLSEEAVRRLVQEAIAASGAKSPQDMGKVMAALMPKVKGRADGALVHKIVKELMQ